MSQKKYLIIKSNSNRKCNKKCNSYYCPNCNCCMICSLMDVLYYEMIGNKNFDKPQHPLFEEMASIFMKQIDICKVGSKDEHRNSN